MNAPFSATCYVHVWCLSIIHEQKEPTCTCICCSTCNRYTPQQRVRCYVDVYVHLRNSHWWTWTRGKGCCWRERREWRWRQRREWPPRKDQSLDGLHRRRDQDKGRTSAAQSSVEQTGTVDEKIIIITNHIKWCARVCMPALEQYRYIHVLLLHCTCTLLAAHYFSKPGNLFLLTMPFALEFPEQAPDGIFHEIQPHACTSEYG